MERQRRLHQREVLHVEHDGGMVPAGRSHGAGDPLGVAPGQLGTGAVPNGGGIDRHVHVQARGTVQLRSQDRLHHCALDQRGVVEVLAKGEQRGGDAVLGAQPPSGNHGGVGTFAPDETGGS